MKKLLSAAVLSATAMSSSAYAIEFYIEAQLGVASISDMDTSTAPVQMFNAMDDSAVPGFEFGFNDFEPASVLRLGFGYQRIDTQPSMTVIDDGVSIFEATPEDIEDISLLFGEEFDIDGSADIFSANLYYDFPTESAFDPYFGIGVAAVDVDWADDVESGLTYTLGTRFRVNNHFAAGFKYQYTKVKDISNGAVEINQMKFGAWSATFDYIF